jgi:hypothetical protein
VGFVRVWWFIGKMFLILKKKVVVGCGGCAARVCKQVDGAKC